MRTFTLIVFLCLTPLAFPNPFSNSLFWLFANEPQIPNGMILTPESAFRAAEGELLTSIGSQKSRVTPFQWQTLPNGVVRYTTQDQGIQYVFEVLQADIKRSAEPTAARAGLLSVTASNSLQDEQTAVLWIEWRNESKPAANGMQGLLLDSSRQNPTVPYIRSWNSKWPWLFYKNALLRDRWIVYYVPDQAGWEEEHWIRKNEGQFHDLAPDSIVGVRRYAATLAGSKKVSLQIWVPFIPISFNEFPALSSSTLLGESTPVGLPESQRKTQ